MGMPDVMRVLSVPIVTITNLRVKVTICDSTVNPFEPRKVVMFAYLGCSVCELGTTLA